ncbi:BZ3500_MvSof-1268-A1-R1_Chr12-2g03878 [Microbotryum saponariae]|uniref:BZ3500_MvSof-1268-A1-R1_Chr12-2g03717 protein n=1 Tax=Microbotryum saponariae TaxID=289078 RepID=A0A2X0KMN5_9BASI|nr:BZ3500_MvSof-1268-A1-R1_Chr12-2g03717 [Microbotryum saponariae]SCZ94406.1 BZ3500_MvSof-1268-A1-R1_Chr12-2g03878 [Microbotryum saponariae]SDA05305.1 BZ3501_MvSof-1269-A2-R1_Chr12-1g03289 [Microbotryum saponariae]
MPNQPNQFVSGDYVVQTKGDGSHVVKDYSNVQQGYNGLYNNPQHSDLKDYAQAQSHQLSQQYYQQHQQGGNSSGRK